jgi:hypothetical protein
MRAFGEVAILIVVFFAGIALAWPRGDFPLDDDQYYGLPAINLARTGHLELSIAAAPNARAQVLAGSVFVKMFGASFESLRLLTLILAALSIALVNRTLALTGVTKFARVAGSIALAFHPIFFWSSCTFMTEVPYVFASALSLYLYCRGLRDDRLALVLFGGAAVALSWWVRQTGVLNALPPIALLAIYRDRITARWRAHLALSALPIAVFTILYFVRRDLLLASPGEFHSLVQMWSEATFRLPEQIALVRHYVVFTLQNAALFSLGLVIPAGILLSRKPKRWDAIVLSIGVVVILGTMFELVHHDTPIPFYSKRVCCDLLYGNVFMNFGLGPPTLTDVWSTKYEYPFHISENARALLTWLSGIGALVLFWAVLDAWRTRSRDPRPNVVLLLAVASIAISTAGLCVSAVWMDRYVLDAAWPMVIVLALIIPLHANARVAAIVALTIVALFSVCATQEYFSWNRARWASYYDLRRGGVPMTQIDGGAEPYNAFEVAFVKDWKIKRKMSFGPGSRRYVIAFHEMPGFRVVARRPFTGWFGLHRGEIVTLERMQ